MLTAKDLTVRFGEVAALDGVDLSVATGEVMAVLGPSGSGKTTLLRAIAGLIDPDSGTVSWDGEDVTGVPVHRRGFGLMFQDYALFPHKSVYGNVSFGLRMQRLDAADIETRVRRALEQVGLEGLGDRAVGSLSGGQQQRVALARAIAPQPRLLMFDEPLGSLDRGLRERLVVELSDVLERVGITTLYVTHDQEEAFGLADRVMLLRDGTVEQVASPLEMWSAPRTEFAARFLGFNNVVARDLAGSLGWPVPEAGGAGAVVYRPDGFSPRADGPVGGTVLKRTYRGDHFLVRLDTGGGPEIDVVVRWTPVPERGESLRLGVDPDAVFSVEE
jgi:thiamine transport system ATP-binding protein